MPWITVAATDDVPPGGRMTVGFESRDVVIWRSVAGVLAACDARCPHQWAHLGAAGVVDGEVLVCLSHGWCFDAEGEGFKVSAAGRRDEKSPVDVVAVREENGSIDLDIDGGVLRIETHAP